MRASLLSTDTLSSGTVAERPNALVLKTRELSAPGVQIPPVPPWRGA